jgi:hypothetical protein
VPLTFNAPQVPEQFRDLVVKLESYGFSLKKDALGIWVLYYPPGDLSGFSQVAFQEQDLGVGLLGVLRSEENRRGVLYRYQQTDKQWSSVVYGNTPGDTTIGAAGCGPTSLAIVLQYLMNNGSRPRDACYAVTPPETAGYAATHGRVSGHGTAGDPMIRGIKERWPSLDGSRVSLHEAADLLEEGKLVIFLCKGCQGWSRQRPVHRAPDVKYGGHYMVLAGIEGPPGPDQLFYVVDPGRGEERAMRFITRSELQRHTGGFWWVYQQGEPATRSSSMSSAP